MDVRDPNIGKEYLLSSYKRRYEYVKLRTKYDYRFGAGVVAVSMKELGTDLGYGSTYDLPVIGNQAFSIGQVTPDEMDAICKDASDTTEILTIMARACFISRERFQDAYALGNLLVLTSICDTANDGSSYLLLSRPLVEAIGAINGVGVASYLYVSDGSGMRQIVAYDALTPQEVVE